MIAPPGVVTDGPAVDAARDEAPVLGDGTTFRSRTGRRWRAARIPVIVLAIVTLFAVLAGLFEPETSDVPLAADNPGADGGRAVARVLEKQGVSVEYTRSRTQAVELARDGATLAIFRSQLLPDELSRELALSGANLVLFEPSASILALASDGALEPARAGTAGMQTRSASCSSDETGRQIDSRIGAITSGGSGYRAAAPDRVTLCFPLAQEDATGSYASLVRDDGVRVDVVDDARLITNEAVIEEGNAALALHMLGQTGTLIWYVPDPQDLASGDSAPSGLFATLPAPTTALIWLAGFVTIALMMWRGRRLGPVVTEPLPVVVPAAEATRGRGRLYRRQRSYGHASAGLRAGAADRLANRTGLPRSASAPELIDAIARATGHQAEHVAALLYGPPPTSDIEFVRLAAALDTLENEVYNP